MNSKQISLLAKNPFIKAFTLQIIKNIREGKIDYRFEDKINTDLIPKVNEKKRTSILEPQKQKEEKPLTYTPLFFKRKEIYSQPTIAPRVEKIPMFSKSNGEIPKEALTLEKHPQFVEVKKPHVILTPKIKPIEKQIAQNIPFKEEIKTAPKVIPHPIINVANVPQKISQKRPFTEQKIVQGQGYEQLQLLINDSSVSLIECAGAKKPLTIMRKGRKQPTKIILTEEDIKRYLKEISEKTHIPLLEGVFRTITGPLSINAVISEIIGSKFIIKKHLF